MVFRKDSKIDAFQRQISALRHQLGTSGGNPGDPAEAEEYPAESVPEGDAGRHLAEPYPPPAYAEPEPYSPYADVAVPQQRGDEMSTPASAIAEPLVDSQTSVIAHDTIWKGDLVSEGTIHVHGRVEGTIKAKQDVYVAEEADIDATITATNVIIAGYVKGGIRCGNRFEVLPQGRVDGEIQAPSLVIHDGATIVGQFRMGTGEGTETRPASVVQRRATRGSA